LPDLRQSANNARQATADVGRQRRAKKILIIRRLRCEDCKRIHHELPDCIVPYKRICAETIESITNGSDEAPCENRFISRILAWWLAVKAYFLNILKALAQKHGAFYQEPPAFKEIIRAVVNSNNWFFAKSILNPFGRAVRNRM